MEGAGAVEEFEVEGGGGLTVDFPAGAGLHGHLLLWEVVWRCWVWLMCHRIFCCVAGVFYSREYQDIGKVCVMVRRA